ncbi:MAG: filamentous hemagglutinin N-terminal domain-containing protein [Schwartzia succinivorans]|uniref:two-partner secretion domain-containing protein n=1 Tax=Schwartzia succinivorans TaxID=55507 RepID=UPI002357A556|nr:filamentous hemagglutinin N-terminal domain-containing protein [Schwartzia succinivorans]MBE6097941.1 filamentous hemagglutinin N-terminal domain-containing protein [Schwartzia succinivorans]
MSLPRISKKARLSAAIAMTLFSASVSTVYALPTGGEVQSGTAEIKQNGSEMNINQGSDRVAIDWTNFDIAHGETVNFNQPGADSIALNRVIGNDVSQIYGSLTANGQVFLINPNGVLFGKGASVDVGGLYASTANVNDNFMKEFGGSTGNFNLSIDDANKAAIINQATINAKIKDEGGIVVLHAANVDNEGTIQTGKGGKVQLAAGQKLNVNFDSTKINFTVDGGLSEANVLNAGTISAQNGVIAMTARGADKVLSSVVNTEGARLEAKGLAVNEKGEIVLDAGTGITAISGTVDASGENGADGGNITVNSNFIYVDNKAELNASGANGGKVEMNTVKVTVEPNANIHAEATAEKGHTGQWKVDVNGSVNSWWGNEGQLDNAKKRLTDAKKEVEKLFETAQATYAEAEEAKKARDAAQAKVNELTKKIEAAATDNQTKQEALKKAEGELTQAKEALKEAQGKQTEAQNKLTEAQNALNGAKTAKANAENANNDAAEALKNAQGAYEKAEQAAEAAQKALDDANSALTSAINKQSEAQTAYDNAKSAADTAAQELATANSEKATVQAYYNLAESNYKTKVQDAETAKQNAENAQDAYNTVCGFVGTLDDIREQSKHELHIGYLKDTYIHDFKEAYKALKEYAPNNLSEGYKQQIEQENGWENFWNGFLSWFNWDYERQHNAAKNTRSMFEDARNFEQGAYSAAQQAVSEAETTKNGLLDSLGQAEAKVTEKQTAKDNADAEVTRTNGELNTANTNKTSAEAAVGEATTNLGTANAAAEKAKGEAESAKNLADEAAGKLNDANGAVTKAQGDFDAAQTAKNSADAAVTDADTKQQGAQTAYNDAESALTTSNEDLAKLGEDKTSSEKAAADNEAVRAAADAENKATLKVAMDGLVAANKAYAQSAYNKAKQEAYGKIGSQAISNTLKNTDVEIVAHNDTNTADIGMYGSIMQDKGNATTLTLTADRNVMLRSTISAAKELNIVTEAGSPIELEQGNRDGEKFGATLIYSDINTEGNLDITGNTYIGHYIRGNKTGEENGNDIHREAGKITAKNVRFGGDVVLATGGTVDVTADKEYGKVTFEGTINSGNAYAFREITKKEQAQLQAEAAEQGEGVHPNYWEYARNEAKKANGHVAGESYLATITDSIEDSAASAVRPGNYSESYVGGKADEWVENEDGTRSRDWEWVDGPEAGETFFTQIKNKNKKAVSGSAAEGYYSNFLAGEPSDSGELQDVLAIEYKGHWDDAFATGNKNGEGYAKSFIQEINVGESSLNINSANIELKGEVGNKRALNSIGLEGNTASIASPITTKGDMTINAALTGKNISLTSTEGSITLNNTVTAGTPKVEEAAAPQLRLMRLRSAVPTEGDIELNAAKDISSNGVTAQNKISFNAGNNVNLNGELKAGSNENGAVQISAGEAFINKVGANVIDTNGTWQIYSATPENDVFNGLNSNNTAIWNADGTVNNDGKNTYSFKYQPTLTVTANDVTKTYGDVSTGDGCKVTSNLVGENKNGEDLSKVFKDTTLGPNSFVEGVKLTSDGFASLASVAEYDIKATASGKNGYGLDFKSGKLTVNPKNVTLSYGGFEIVNNRINVLEGTPSYDSQVVEGDTTAPKVAYGTTGLGDGLSYGVDYYVNGEKISSGDTVGNYRFNYDDSTVIRLDNPENYKPQTNALMTSAVALKGNADVELSQKTAKVDGVDKVAGLMDGRLPLFKFAGSQVIPCGMFDISSTPDSVTMTASKISETDMSAVMEMPELEVNQYREYDRMLDTVDGAAAFKLTYNGASFDIYPNDDQAMALLEKGEETNNVNVGAAALSAAFGEMGLSLEEMQVICVHMDAKEILA